MSIATRHVSSYSHQDLHTCVQKYSLTKIHRQSEVAWLIEWLLKTKQNEKSLWPSRRGINDDKEIGACALQHTLTVCYVLANSRHTHLHWKGGVHCTQVADVLASRPHPEEKTKKNSRTRHLNCVCCWSFGD